MSDPNLEDVIDDWKAQAKSWEMLANSSRERAEAAEARVAELERLIYVPGLWKCAKCDFSLVQANLNALDGSVTARDEPGEKCPNGCGPLWRVTERDAGNDMVDRCDEQVSRAVAAEAHVAELESGAESAEIISTMAFKAGEADMCERAAKLVERLGLRARVANAIRALLLDGGDGE